MRKLDASNCHRCGLDGLEPGHRRTSSPDRSVILLDEVVEVLCEQKINAYIETRGERAFAHREPCPWLHLRPDALELEQCRHFDQAAASCVLDLDRISELQGTHGADRRPPARRTKAPPEVDPLQWVPRASSLQLVAELPQQILSPSDVFLALDALGRKTVVYAQCAAPLVCFGHDHFGGIGSRAKN